MLEKIKTKPPKMLGTKICKFKESKVVLADKYIGDFDKLVKKLWKFNENWTITKHGMIVGGKQELTFRKDGEFHTFDPKRQEEIDQEFTEIMGALTEIWNGM